MANFWKKLKKPILILAPMEDVTDHAFREIVCQLAKPDILFTEFTSAEALKYKTSERVYQKLKYSENQRPIVAQIWGGNPENLYDAAKLVREYGFDGVDINLGCPEKNVMKKPAGSGLIGNYDVVDKIIKAVKEGAGGLPVSVKTRMRYKNTTIDEWVGFLLKYDLAAITIHGRTPEQQSTGTADWNEVGRMVELRNKTAPGTLIIGNGDVKTYADAVDKYDRHKVDGIMIGRGIFHNPWIFAKEIKPKERSKEEYLQTLLGHMELFEKTWGRKKNFAILKKFFKIYVKDFDGASVIRDRLMKSKNSHEVREILSGL